MGYNFKIDNYYKIKHKEKEYPWPCGGHPNRTIVIFDDDVLTKGENGKFTKHTGICCLNIIIPVEDVIKQDDVANLRLM